MKVDALRYAVLLPTLHAVHNVIDHVVQTDDQAARKQTDTDACVSHAGQHALATLAVGLVATRRPGRALIGAVFVGVTHGFWDRRWPVVRLLECTGSARFARPAVQTRMAVDAKGRWLHAYGVPTDATARGPLPIHGQYLADQALHHACLALAALIMAVTR